jgi:hypothetical protein
MIDLSTLKIWTAEEFEQAFPPPPEAAKPNGASAGAQGAGDIDIDAAGFPDDLREMIRDGVSPGADRSVAFFKLVKALRGEGYAVDQIFECLVRFFHGIAQKYLDPKELGSPARLRREVERAYNRPKRRTVNLNQPQPPPPAPAPAPSSPPPPAPSAPAVSTPLPQALADARETFRKWLGEKYDTDVLDAVASAGAAERLGGDPLWLMVISGSGNAKTETVQPLEGAGALVTSTISGEGALLSATARSHGSTGGLLHKIGSRGLLVIKDLTTLLSMDGKARSVVLAALREIHDGRWERNVGYAGGRTLPWTGRIVVVAACTTAWDEARKLIETLGDRFALIRSDSTKWRQEAARQAIGNAGSETSMRTELAQVMGVLVASADVNVRGLTDGEKAQLIKLADLVTWARSGVERDYKGAIVNAHAREMPTRFAKQLAMVMRGALSLGISTDEAMRLAARVARDSFEPLRLDLLRDVAANPDTNPANVHRRTAKPLTTVKNTLIAMHTLRLLACDERDERHGSRTYTVPYYSLAPEFDAGTFANMK